MLLRVRGRLGGRRTGRRGRGGAIHHVLQFLAGLEVRNLLGGHFDAGAGLGIAANAGLALARAETAESANLDLIAGPEGTDDAVENGLHDDFRLLACHLHHAGDFFNQIGLCHRILLEVSMGYDSATRSETAVSRENGQIASYSVFRSLRLIASSIVVVAAAAWRW